MIFPIFVDLQFGSVFIFYYLTSMLHSLIISLAELTVKLEIDFAGHEIVIMVVTEHRRISMIHRTISTYIEFCSGRTFTVN